MNAGIGHTVFPLQQKLVLFGQTLEQPSLERVVLHIFDPGLDLAFVAWRIGLGGQNDRLIMLGKRQDLGIKLRIEPVGLGDRRPQIINDGGVGHAPKITKRIFQTPDEVLGGLLPDRFAIAFTRMTEHDPKHVGSLALARDFNPCPFAKIDLHLQAGFTFHAPPGQRRRSSKASDKPLHGLIAADEPILSN